MLACFHSDRVHAQIVGAVGSVRRREVASDASLVVEQRDALTVDRDVDVLEARSGSPRHVDAEGVLRVDREDVISDDAAARSERRTFDMIPGMLRSERRRIVYDERRGCLPVTDRRTTHRRGGIQIRLEQGRRQRLHVGDVVEVRALRVEREVQARVDLDAEQVADGCFVLGTIETLERARAGIRFGGCFVDRLLERLDEREQGITARFARLRRRHHLRAQLPYDLL